MQNVITAPENNTSLSLDILKRKALEYSKNASASNTRLAYDCAWKHFTAWCADHRYETLPASPEALALYVVSKAETCSISGIKIAVAAIADRHKRARAISPTADPAFISLWSGLCRSKGTSARPKPAASLDLIAAKLPQSDPGDLAALRDRAMILLGYAGALRRGELVALKRQDVSLLADGLRINVRRSKTDQNAEGEVVGVPYADDPAICPVRAVQAWVEAVPAAPDAPLLSSVYNNVPGKKHLTGRTVANTVKRYLGDQYSAHSLRSGLSTDADTAGADVTTIQRHLRHKNLRTTQGYIQSLNPVKRSAANSVFRAAVV